MHHICVCYPYIACEEVKSPQPTGVDTLQRDCEAFRKGLWQYQGFGSAAFCIPLDN